MTNPEEYAVQYPELKPFAALYTRLRYSIRSPSAVDWEVLRAHYQVLVKQARRPGIRPYLRRIFNLKCLGYR